MKQYRKNIYKKEYISEIFNRSLFFYEQSFQSKLFFFPKPISFKKDVIIYQYIDFDTCTLFDSFLTSEKEKLFLVEALLDFYQRVNGVKDLKINTKYILHWDLHFWNIFLHKDKKRMLFIDPETPDRYDYRTFTENTICFEIAYLLYHLDNHFPIWSHRFYNNNYNFKQTFLLAFGKKIATDLDDFISEIYREYKNHIYRKFEFSYNPVLLFHRCFRFLIIYIKYFLWIQFQKYSAK